MAGIYFKEEQKFNQWWIWLIIVLCFGIWIWQFTQQIIMGKPFGTNPMPDIAVILTGLFPVLVLLLFRIMKLETIIDENGVKCRFRPFQKNYKSFPANDIARYEVKKYNPIREYGGWGIRVGFFRNSSAYNVKGNQGLYLVLRNNKSFLIGTQVPDSIRRAMEKMMKAQSGSV